VRPGAPRPRSRTHTQRSAARKITQPSARTHRTLRLTRTRTHARRAAQGEAPPLRFSDAEEAALDARLDGARAALAGSLAATAAMRAERARLEAELTAGGGAAARLRALAAAAGPENGREAAETALKAVVTLTQFVPLLEKAELLRAQAAAALQPPRAAEGACAVRRACCVACARPACLCAAHVALTWHVDVHCASRCAAAAVAADDAARRAAASGGGVSALSALNARIHGAVA
jgi:hypothetical protein